MLQISRDQFYPVLEEFETIDLAEAARLAGCGVPENSESPGARLLDTIRYETIAAAETTVNRGRSPFAVIHSGLASKIVSYACSGWTDMASTKNLVRLAHELGVWRCECRSEAPWCECFLISGPVALKSLEYMGETLVRALVDAMEDRYQAMVSGRLADMYADELNELSDLGLSPRIVNINGLYTIRTPLEDLGGRPAYLLVSNGLGLATSPDEVDCWSASVYTVHSESDIPLEAMFSDGFHAVEAVRSVLDAMRASTRVAVRTDQTGDDWAEVWCPIAALGDDEQERAAIRPQVFKGYRPGVIVLDGAAGFAPGCSTHSHIDRDDLEQAREGHWDCEHDQFTNEQALNTLAVTQPF